MRGKYITIKVRARVSEDEKTCLSSCPAFFETSDGRGSCQISWKLSWKRSTGLRRAADGGHYRCAACKRAEVRG